MFKQFKAAAVALSILGILLTGACGTQPSHPNQINAFDGATFDTLLLAHVVRLPLLAAETTVSTSYPKYVPIFNEAAAAYNTANATYATAFRTTPTTQAEVTVTITNLTVAIVALEDAFQTDMQASPTMVAQIRAKAKRLRSSAGQAGIFRFRIFCDGAGYCGGGRAHDSASLALCGARSDCDSNDGCCARDRGCRSRTANRHDNDSGDSGTPLTKQRAGTARALFTGPQDSMYSNRSSP